MKARDFCYWLQGVFEISDADKNKAHINEQLSREQVVCIRNHLAMVFRHEIDPSNGSAEHNKILNELHTGGILQDPDCGMKLNC